MGQFIGNYNSREIIYIEKVYPYVADIGKKIFIFTVENLFQVNIFETIFETKIIAELIRKIHHTEQLGDGFFSRRFSTILSGDL